MDYPHGEQVTILHPGETTTDPDYGTPVPGDPTPEVVDRAAVAPRIQNRTDTENNRFQATVQSGYDVFLPAGVTVEPDAQMVVRGETFEVDGEPGDWRNPFTGWQAGVQVALRRSE